MQQCEEVSMNFALRNVVPDRVQPIRILRGPFRGAIIAMNPRNSLRKWVGLYEHELNPWLKTVLPRVMRVLDVGANDGYFTFGCAAAFRRLEKTGEIVSFEPDDRHFKILQQAIPLQPAGVNFTLVPAFVGREAGSGVTTLDSVHWKTAEPKDRT